MKAITFSESIAHNLTIPVIRLLARTSIRPNALTWGGFLITLVAAALIAAGQYLIAGIVVLVAGFFDMLDGALARHTSQVTRFGGVLDSTLDRLAEAVLLLALLVQFRSVTEGVLIGLALVGSFMVSYIRARVEVLGLQCTVGLFTRAHRVIVLALGLLLSHIDYALFIALVMIVFFSFFTAGQRLFHAWRLTASD
ncbi:MAG: CDP-alcohol phosphatidyltransferase family protein [Chloroflexi bacterium]|nr:CDP-alcohol phosphatidyltransferase family protein [Chloroflexota bacterium]